MTILSGGFIVTSLLWGDVPGPPDRRPGPAGGGDPGPGRRLRLVRRHPLAAALRRRSSAPAAVLRQLEAEGRAEAAATTRPPTTGPPPMRPWPPRCWLLGRLGHRPTTDELDDARTDLTTTADPMQTPRPETSASIDIALEVRPSSDAVRRFATSRSASQPSRRSATRPWMRGPELAGHRYRRLNRRCLDGPRPVHAIDDGMSGVETPRWARHA